MHGTSQGFTTNTALNNDHLERRDSLSCSLASPRGGTSQFCKYKSGKCSNPRATKRNGQLHTLCHFHRVRQNEHQRKSDRKHRMVSVARRAKLGSLGVMVGSNSRRMHRGSVTSLGSDSTPVSPMDPDHEIELARLADEDRLFHARMSSPYRRGNTVRLPPISFLTQQIPGGKLDGFRSSTNAAVNFSPGTFLRDNLDSEAGRMA